MLKRKRVEIKLHSGPKSGRSSMGGITYHCELDGSALSIACFIGSQFPQCGVCVERNDEPFLLAATGRAIKCKSSLWQREVNRYLRAVHWHFRREEYPPTSEDAENLLLKRYGKRIKAWQSAAEEDAQV